MTKGASIISEAPEQPGGEINSDMNELNLQQMKASFVVRSWRLTTRPSVKGCDYSSGFRDHRSTIVAHSDITALPASLFPHTSTRLTTSSFRCLIRHRWRHFLGKERRRRVTPRSLTRLCFAFHDCRVVYHKSLRSRRLEKSPECCQRVPNSPTSPADVLAKRSGLRGSVTSTPEQTWPRCAARNRHEESKRCAFF